MEAQPLNIIAHIENDYTAKFAIPRQSGLVEGVESRIIFTPAYRNETALRGIDGYSHLWLLWIFSEAIRETWSPTVLPPRLGGKTRMGVFATRSPFRPNPIGLSSVRLLGIEKHPQYGHVLRVAGADLMDGTPILDIKPYLAYTDSHPQATGGFTDRLELQPLQVFLPPELWDKLPEDKRAALIEVLAADPRPSYQHDPERVYGFFFGDWEILFSVDGDCLSVREIRPR